MYIAGKVIYVPWPRQNESRLAVDILKFVLLHEHGYIWFHISLKIVPRGSASIDSGNGFPDSKRDGANMGPIWGRQDPGVTNMLQVIIRTDGSLGYWPIYASLVSHND